MTVLPWIGCKLLYEKTTHQFYIKFISNDYLQMYTTLQQLTSTFPLNTNIFTSIKVICTDTKVTKNAKLIKAWIN
jgi:hypothetical protein